MTLVEAATALQSDTPAQRRAGLARLSVELTTLAEGRVWARGIPSCPIPRGEQPEVVNAALIRIINALAPDRPKKTWSANEKVRSYLRAALATAWVSELRDRGRVQSAEADEPPPDDDPSTSAEAEPEYDLLALVRTVDRVAREAIVAQTTRADARAGYLRDWPVLLATAFGLRPREGNAQEQRFSRLRGYIVAHLDSGAVPQEESNRIKRFLLHALTGKRDLSADLVEAVRRVLAESRVGEVDG